MADGTKTTIKERSYVFALSIIRFIDVLNTKDYSIQAIVKQVIRSGTSISANIIEAQAGSSKKDFTNFYTHALKSADETKFWLSLLRDSGKTDKNQVEILLKEITEIANILGASIVTLKGKR